MKEKDKPKIERPDHSIIPNKPEKDEFRKGAPGWIPPKVEPQWPDENHLNEGGPGWVPP